jgi:hypothetical protein
MSYPNIDQNDQNVIVFGVQKFELYWVVYHTHFHLND